MRPRPRDRGSKAPSTVRPLGQWVEDKARTCPDNRYVLSSIYHGAVLILGQFNGAEMMDLANSPAKSMQQQVEYSQGLHQHLTNALKSNMNKGIAGSAPPMAQGSPQMDPDFLNGMNRGAAGQANGANSNSNHALQDYQMQLMLLEQQNKKRLLMARQEQDNMTNGPGGPGPGQQGGFPQPMSPQGSRTGLSPNPADQMKRGTPKMAPGAVPSPTADGSMPQGRASPVPGFDPSQMNPNMPQNMFPQMKQMGMLGPNGQMMPPSSHPMGAGPMTPQQMEMLRHAQQNGGRMPNGFMPQGPPQMMPGQLPGGPMQHAPNMTPQQRNAAMPPPPAPIGDIARGPQPTSPQAQPAPPTPSQGNKPNAKGKKEKSNKVSHCTYAIPKSLTDKLPEGFQQEGRRRCYPGFRSRTATHSNTSTSHHPHIYSDLPSKEWLACSAGTESSIAATESARSRGRSIRKPRQRRCESKLLWHVLPIY